MIQVKVRGLSGWVKDLEVAENRLKVTIPGLMTDLAYDAAKDARGRARKGMLTGASMDSIMATGARIIAGRGVPWYGFADFGGRVGKGRSIHRIYRKAGRWLFPAVSDVGVIKRSQAAVDDATKGLR